MSARERIASLLWKAVPSSDDAEAKSITEDMLDRHRDEEVANALRGEAGRGFAAGILASAAEYLKAHCPDHGDKPTSFITCQCLAAGELKRMAKPPTGGEAA